MDGFYNKKKKKKKNMFECFMQLWQSIFLNKSNSISDKKRCRKKRRERCCPTSSPSPPTTTVPGVDLKNLCIKKNTKYLVYKAILDKEVFIAFDDLEGGTVEVFRWLISQGRVFEYRTEPRHDKTCLREFPTRPDTNRPAQPKKLARVLKFRL